jgi:tRNA threonylcarbamoyladenosine biosynthesis protein TsaB
MVKLILDTSDNKMIKVGLKIDNKEYVLTKKMKSNKEQVVLPMMDRILKKHSLKLRDISAIQVNPGPGSYTGLRVGIAIANALAFVLKVPVNDSKIGEVILPIYS